MTGVYLRARHVPQVLTAIVLLQIALATLGAHALTYNTGTRYEAISLTGLGQFIVVIAALQVFRSGTTEVEATASRRLLPHRALTLALVVATGLGTAAVAAVTAPPDPAVVGTAGPWVALRNQAGLLGIGLLTARRLDPRIASVIPAALVVLPFLLPANQSPLEPLWAFVLAEQQQPTAATVAAGLLIAGFATQLLPERR